ncbi:hypothetical protein Q644_10990 [Brucella intermedia 229E]|uniref:Uncharacterized protein n=1 Tax=Brucella intermedia 229E TaxID=1337887 RepID=U4VKR0_9HYPH|nr:hypothetical protein Q644_10990 [Brucella intermedia 229E]
MTIFGHAPWRVLWGGWLVRKYTTFKHNLEEQSFSEWLCINATAEFR